MKPIATILFLGSLAVMAQKPSANPDTYIAQASKGLNFYSLERERDLGRWAAANLERALPIVHEPKLDAYVAQLGARLAQHATSPFTYTFTLYEDRRPNSGAPTADVTIAAGAGAVMPMDAFYGPAEEPVSVAGGAIFIPLSLLAAAPDESVFAFQLAHAMAHAAMRHATRQATRTEAMGLSALRAQNTTVADQRTPGNLPEAVPLGALQLSRSFERQADYVAMLIARDAGYSPEPMATYLSNLLAPGKMAKAFSAHPSAAERSKAIRTEFARLPAATYTASTGGFAEAKEIAASVR